MRNSEVRLITRVYGIVTNVTKLVIQAKQNIRDILHAIGEIKIGEFFHAIQSTVKFFTCENFRITIIDKGGDRDWKRLCNPHSRPSHAFFDIEVHCACACIISSRLNSVRTL